MPPPRLRHETAIKRQHPLDSLRGLLAMAVLAAHAWSVFAYPVLHETWSSLDTVLAFAARAAVLAFFTLSGYVIAASISTNVSANGSFRADRFVLARAFRIVPPLVLVIVLTSAFEAVLLATDAATVVAKDAARSSFKTDPLDQVRAIYTLCTRGELTGAWLNGPLWTLTFEIRLYVISGLVALMLFGPNWIVRGVAVALLVTYASAIRLAPKSLGIDLQVTAFAAFLCGALAYRCRGASTRLMIAVSLLGLAAALVHALQAQGPLTANLDKDPAVLASQMAIAVTFAAWVVLIGRGPAWNVLSRSGEYSYTLYIAHFPLFLFAYFAASRYAPELLTPSFAVFTTAAMAVCGWVLLSRLGRWIERPREQREMIARWLDKVTASRQMTL